MIANEPVQRLLDSIGKLYALSSEEKYLKDLESARLAIAIQSMGPILKLIDEATGRARSIVRIDREISKHGQ